MNCERILHALDRYLSGALSKADRDRFETHLHSCRSCAGEVAALTTSSDEEHSLLGGVMAATSGASCERAQQGLSEFEHRGDEAAAMLLRGHLDHCTACSRLAACLELADRILPELAAMPALDAFRESVYALTSQAQLPLIERVFRSVEAAWSAAAARPRFAMEASYALTVLLMLLTVPSASPLHGRAEQALGWLQADPAQASESDQQGFVFASIAGLAAAPTRAVTRGGELSSQVGQDFGVRAEQVSGAMGQFGGHALDFGSALTERDWDRARPVLGEMKCDMRLLWRGVRKQLLSEDDRRC